MDARCLKVKPRERAFKQFKSPVLNVLNTFFTLLSSDIIPTCRNNRNLPFSGSQHSFINSWLLQNLHMTFSLTRPSVFPNIFQSSVSQHFTSHGPPWRHHTISSKSLRKLLRGDGLILGCCVQLNDFRTPINLHIVHVRALTNNSLSNINNCAKC